MGFAAGAAGTFGSALGTAVCDMTPRSCSVTALGLELWVACHAMNRATEKNTMASHLVDFDMKFDAPREPNTVAEAPAPKPEPADAPAPRCMRISAIMESATRTYTTLRINSIVGARRIKMRV